MSAMTREMGMESPMGAIGSQCSNNGRDALRHGSNDETEGVTTGPTFGRSAPISTRYDARRSIEKKGQDRSCNEGNVRNAE